MVKKTISQRLIRLRRKSQKLKTISQRLIRLGRKSLIWVYPSDNWKSISNKTFVYGWSNPLAKLFVSTEDYLTPQRINISPNGNFAKSINLPGIQNNVKLIQFLDNKKTILTRKVLVGAGLAPAQHSFRATVKVAPTKKHYSNKNMIIIIDPGHGGKEHGTHSPKGIPEKYFNLQIAKMLVETLHATSLQGKIYLTRTKDKFISLQDRVDFAKKKKCNVFISIHHNALPDYEDPMKHTGVGIYYTHNFVKPLAKRLLESISKETKLKKYGIFKRNFFVTRPKFYKGVLIECGFLTHPVEAEYITKKETQEKIVRGIVKGLI